MAERSVEELTAELGLEIVAAPVDLIDPNPENPNELPEHLYEALVADIRERGFIQPLLLRREGKRYKLIDGEHRWRAVRELGFEKVPAVISDDEGDEATLRLLSTNRLRGQFVPIRMAYVLADLAQRIPEDELRRRLGMESGEMKDVLRLAAFTDEIGERVREQAERENREAPTVLTFVCSERDAKAIRRAVERLVADGTDSGQALARMAREWEKLRKKETA